MTDTITLPRSVVEQALEALDHASMPYGRDWALHGEARVALRAALEQTQGEQEQHLNMVPTGWKLVPMEPTASMVLAGEVALKQHDFLRLDASYRSMLAAAPQPPVVEQPQVGEVVVTTNQEGQCVAVTRQDDDGCILSVIWEAQQPRVKQEPVAYEYVERRPYGAPGEIRRGTILLEHYRNDDGTIAGDWDWLVEQFKTVKTTISMRPLYTHPQPPRKPLTDEEILMVLDAADIPDLPRDFKDVDIDIARAIEEAHGITEDA